MLTSVGKLLFSKPNWIWFGNGHIIKCSCSANDTIMMVYKISKESPQKTGNLRSAICKANYGVRLTSDYDYILCETNIDQKTYFSLIFH